MDIRTYINKTTGFLQRHRVACVITAGATVMVMLMSMVMLIRREVHIYIDGAEAASFTTFDNEASKWLEHAGIEIYDGDIWSNDDNSVNIQRAFYITVNADGRAATYKTVSSTVREAISAGEIALSQADIVTPALDETVTPDAVITIARVSKSRVTENETVKYTTKKIKTNDLYEGQSEVVTKGENGEIEYVYDITSTDGVETSRVLVSETTVKEAVEKVVRVGTKIKSSFLKTASTPTSYKSVIAMNGSAYTYGSDGGNRTCLGKPTARGIVAVDPKVIPLGTRLYIESADGKYIYGEAVAGDTGGSIKGNKIDLFVESASECRSFGRRTVNVYILD